MHITITPETIIMAVSALWALVSWLRERKLLPAPLSYAVDKIGMDRLAAYITNAATLVDKSPAQRREWVILQVTAMCKREHLNVPDGFIRIAVEYAYQRLMKARL